MNIRILGAAPAETGNRPHPVERHRAQDEARTPGGLVPATAFAPEGLSCALACDKGRTPFLRLAQNAGTKHLADGVGMPVEQAAEGFNGWRGVRPETSPVIRRMTAPLI